MGGRASKGLQTCGLPRTYYRIKFTDLVVSSYSATGGEGVPTESLSLNFTKIEWTYISQGADGTPEEISGGWDVKANKAL